MRLIGCKTKGERAMNKVDGPSGPIHVNKVDSFFNFVITSSNFLIWT